MTRDDKVRRICDMMCDGHAEIVTELQKFHANELKANRCIGDGAATSATPYTNRATCNLAKATSLMKLQAQRLTNLVWEIEQAV